MFAQFTCNLWTPSCSLDSISDRRVASWLRFTRSACLSTCILVLAASAADCLASLRSIRRSLAFFRNGLFGSGPMHLLLVLVLLSLFTHSSDGFSSTFAQLSLAIGVVALSLATFEFGTSATLSTSPVTFSSIRCIASMSKASLVGCREFATSSRCSGISHASFASIAACESIDGMPWSSASAGALLPFFRNALNRFNSFLFDFDKRKFMASHLQMSQIRCQGQCYCISQI